MHERAREREAVPRRHHQRDFIAPRSYPRGLEVICLFGPAIVRTRPDPPPRKGASTFTGPPRHEYASRLVEKGVPLAQVRDFLGHASITTTERYDNQKLENLQAAVARLESGKSFDPPPRGSAPPTKCQVFARSCHRAFRPLRHRLTHSVSKGRLQTHVEP
jgi:hypothetical protein